MKGIDGVAINKEIYGRKHLLLNNDFLQQDVKVES